jgi:hypothetical protein
MRLCPLIVQTVLVVQVVAVWSSNGNAGTRNDTIERALKGKGGPPELRFNTAWVMQNDRPNRYHELYAGFAVG